MTKINYDRLKIIKQTPYLITDDVLLSDFKWLVQQAIRGQLMEEALKFYANKEHYFEHHDDLLGEVPSEIHFDEGEVARIALEGLK